MRFCNGGTNEMDDIGGLGTGGVHLSLLLCVSRTCAILGRRRGLKTISALEAGS